jgi:tRNA pseudouridine55 synthase
MRDGILIIDKPEGISSAKTVFKIKKLLKLDKVGHTGTLDPFATGVLVLCLNRSTKEAAYFINLDKTYTGTMILGISTDTQDLTGKAIRINSQKRLTHDGIESAFRKFKGDIWQTPPMYSAIKSKGKPLYRLARKGIKIKVEPRMVTIHQLSLLKIRQDIYPSISFKVKCSKGTYIRTLCNDIGDYLGFGAYLSSLRRIQVGNISINQSISLDKLMELPPEKQESLILPVSNFLNCKSKKE